VAGRILLHPSGVFVVDKRITSHRDLEIYRRAFEAAMAVFDLTRNLPQEEAYSMVDPLRRASRSVCANLASAWRRRHFRATCMSKLFKVQSSAAETQVWIEFAVRCQYLTVEKGRELYATYKNVLKAVDAILNKPDAWSRKSARVKKPQA
jgi:four helix bundle protein